MKRIILSLGMVVFVGAVIAGATGAFFSDTETSTDNVFAAGNIDLRIDNESYVKDFNLPNPPSDPTGQLAFNSLTSWELTDLVAGTHKFFDFYDLKPGDYGEDTISIHVGSNDAWMCAAARLTVDSDENCTEPEQTDENGNCIVETDGTNGDLASQLNFAFWADDGDNVFEEESEGENDEVVFLSGPLSGLGQQGQITLVDSGGGPFGPDPIPGDETVFIGKVWCFGDLTPAPVEQDDLGQTGTFGDRLNGPEDRGTGWSCNGEPLNNIAQTDKVQGDMQFYAEQARNNPDFLCDSDYDPSWPQQNATLTLEKVVIGGGASDTDWTLSASGPTPISGVEGNSAVTNAVVTPGTYDLSEDSGPGGFQQDGPWVCVGGTQDDDDTVTIAAGESVTCTVTNTSI